MTATEASRAIIEPLSATRSLLKPLIRSGEGEPASNPGLVAGSPIDDAIRAKLKKIEREHNVKIPLAVESGSRAWGFASADSDYDVRFVFVGPPERYLIVGQPPSVIEEPIAGGIDASGWDLRKALNLMVGGNAVILEWLRSPVIYRKQIEFADTLLELAHIHLDRRTLLGHYYGATAKVVSSVLDTGTHVVGKRYFYMLRPALALRWLRTREGIPPMSTYALLETCDDQIRNNVNSLIVWKQSAKEMELLERQPLLEDFIDGEMRWALDALKAEKKKPKDLAAVNKFFCDCTIDVGNGHLDWPL